MMPYCIETLTVKEADAMNIYQSGILGGEVYGGHVMHTLLAVCILRFDTRRRRLQIVGRS